MKPLVCAVYLCLALVMGCNQTDETALKMPATENTQDVSQEEPILIGLIPEHSIFNQLKRYQPLADYLSTQIGRKIELKMLVRYGNIIDNFQSAKLDGAFFGSFTYALAHQKLGIQVLARPERLDGTSTYHGLMFVRKDSGIQTVQDMKGKIFVFVDKATTAGFLLPMAYLKNKGVDNYKSYFKETYFAGTHGDAIYDVLRKRADIGAAKNTVFDRLASNNQSVRDELKIVATSPEVPENALAVRKDLDEFLKTNLKEILLNMHNDLEGQQVLKNFGVRRFIETVDRDYQPVFDYAENIDLDLSTYDYINE